MFFESIPKPASPEYTLYEPEKKEPVQSDSAFNFPPDLSPPGPTTLSKSGLGSLPYLPEYAS